MAFAATLRRSNCIRLLLREACCCGRCRHFSFRSVQFSEGLDLRPGGDWKRTQRLRAFHELINRRQVLFCAKGKQTIEMKWRDQDSSEAELLKELEMVPDWR
jgi:hypothetical protein